MNVLHAARETAIYALLVGEWAHGRLCMTYGKWLLPSGAALPPMHTNQPDKALNEHSTWETAEPVKQKFKIDRPTRPVR